MTQTLVNTISPLEPIQHKSWDRHVGAEEYWTNLRFLADSFDDAQKFRIMTENRVRSGELNPLDNDILESARAMEHTIKLRMVKWFRQSGFRDFQMRNKGLGEHMVARLLGHLHDPLVAQPAHFEEGTKAKKVLVHDEPFYRSVSQLWQFCGHGAPGRRTKGMSQEEALKLGNPMLKKLTFMCAESCMKQKPAEGEEAPLYRAIYEERKEETLGKLHTVACVRCGPSGKPAQIGSAWSDAHRHADALRIVGKEILRDLWLEARFLHGFED